MKHLDFWSRLGSLVLAVAALCVYQAHALQWQAAEDENKQQIAEAQAQNAAAEGGAVSYADGTYTGSGDGFGGTVSVEVTVSPYYELYNNLTLDTVLSSNNRIFDVVSQPSHQSALSTRE